MAGATSPFCVFYKLMGKWIWRKLQKFAGYLGNMSMRKHSCYDELQKNLKDATIRIHEMTG